MSSLHAKITLCTSERVTLEFSDGQTLTIPATDVEGVPTQGMDVRVIIAALGSEDAGRSALARDLLNTLLSA